MRDAEPELALLAKPASGLGRQATRELGGHSLSANLELPAEYIERAEFLLRDARGA